MATSSFVAHPYETAFVRAEKYIAKGRNKVNRVVANNTLLQRINDDAIAVVLHSTAVVTYHRNGTFTIYGGGWNTPTTKDRIKSFSPAHPYSNGHDEWVVGLTGEKTPSKVQKCRSCKARGKWMEADYCYGPSYWGFGTGHSSNRCSGAKAFYAIEWVRGTDEVTGERFDNFKEYSDSRYTVPCEHGQEEGHFIEPCQHGEFGRHRNGESMRTCHRCDGTGKAEYGNKDVPVLVSAYTPYRVDVEGKYLGIDDQKPPAYVQYGSLSFTDDGEHYIHHTAYKPAGYTMGSETESRLAAVVPGIRTEVKHPITDKMLSVSDCIISLNDTHKWSREKIADWLDTLDVNLRFPTTEGD